MVRGGLLAVPVWLMLLALGIGGLLLFNYSRSMQAPKAPEFPIVSASEFRFKELKACGLSFDLALLCSEPESLRGVLDPASEGFLLKNLDAELSTRFPKLQDSWKEKGSSSDFQRELELRLRDLVNSRLPEGAKGRALDASVSSLRPSE